MEMIPEISILLSCAPAQHFQTAALPQASSDPPAAPINPSCGVSLPDAPDRAAPELLEAGVGWCQCPMALCPGPSVTAQIPGCCR